MKKGSPRSVLDMIMKRWEGEASEAIFPELYVDKAKTLEEALLKHDILPSMDYSVAL